MFLIVDAWLIVARLLLRISLACSLLGTYGINAIFMHLHKSIILLVQT